MPSRRVGNLRQSLLDFNNRAKTEVAREMVQIGKDLRKEHQDVVSDWEHKPDFAATTQFAQGSIGVDIKVKGQHKKIWRYVDEGTRPHLILPRVPGGRLKFRTGYSPRTLPIAQAHMGTGTASGAFVSAEQVNHPGTEAREFGKTIAEDYKPEFRRRIENAFRRAARR